MFSPTQTNRPGDTLDHFLLENLVATSGMASVFRARDLTSGQQVALKIPHPEVEADPALFERFLREEQIGTRLDNPGVMKVLPNPGRTQVYMVMEWLDGRLLRQLLNEIPPEKSSRLPPARAVAIALSIARALEYIHSQGVVHRDLKPENIMVDPSDHVRLIDFGIAASAGARRLTFANFSRNMGTPDYISPEQVRGKRGDARSDVYSLGVILYEMLTGRVPFTGPNPFAVMNDRLLNQPPAPSTLEPTISPQLQEILFRALEREPKNRYASAREFAHDLEHQEEVGIADRPELASPKPRRSPRTPRLALYAVFIFLPFLIFALLFLVARHH